MTRPRSPQSRGLRVAALLVTVLFLACGGPPDTTDPLPTDIPHEPMCYVVILDLDRREMQVGPYRFSIKLDRAGILPTGSQSFNADAWEPRWYMGASTSFEGLRGDRLHGTISLYDSDGTRIEGPFAARIRGERTMYDVDRSADRQADELTTLDAVAETYLQRNVGSEDGPVKVIATRDVTFDGPTASGIYVFEADDEELMIRLLFRKHAKHGWQVAGELGIGQLPQAHPMDPPQTPEAIMRMEAAAHIEAGLGKTDAVYEVELSGPHGHGTRVCVVTYKLFDHDAQDQSHNERVTRRVVFVRNGDTWRLQR